MEAPTPSHQRRDPEAGFAIADPGKEWRRGHRIPVVPSFDGYRAYAILVCRPLPHLPAVGRLRGNRRLRARRPLLGDPAAQPRRALHRQRLRHLPAYRRPRRRLWPRGLLCDPARGAAGARLLRDPADRDAAAVGGELVARPTRRRDHRRAFRGSADACIAVRRQLQARTRRGPAGVDSLGGGRVLRRASPDRRPLLQASPDWAGGGGGDRPRLGESWPSTPTLLRASSVRT